MPYDEAISNYPSVKGLSLELPFLKFRYLKYTGTRQAFAVNEPDPAVASAPSRAAAVSRAPEARLVFRQEAPVTTMGMDPLVSFASVIHELAFGRVSPEGDVAPSGVYPQAAHSPGRSIDFVV